jgi:hypothetical protein
MIWSMDMDPTTRVYIFVGTFLINGQEIRTWGRVAGRDFAQA